MWNPAKWRTAISAESGRHESAHPADREESAGTASAVRAIAAIAVAGGAGVLAVLPALVGLGLVSRSVVAGVATLAALAGGVKLAVTAWALVASWLQRPWPWTAAASSE